MSTKWLYYVVGYFQKVGRIHDPKAEDFDKRERDEELARMREHVMNEVQFTVNIYRLSIVFFKKQTYNGTITSSNVCKTLAIL